MMDIKYLFFTFVRCAKSANLMEMAFEYRNTMEGIKSQWMNYEKCLLPGFVALIYEAELYTQYMKEMTLTSDQVTLLIDIYNEISME